MLSGSASKNNLGGATNKDWDNCKENINTESKNFENKLSETQRLELEYYGNLELHAGADFAQIKSQYRKLLKKYHPDKFQNNKEKQKIAEEVVCKINAAYNYFEQKMR